MLLLACIETNATSGDHTLARDHRRVLGLTFENQ